MTDVQHDDLVVGLVDPVEDPESGSPSRPDALQFVAEPLPDAVGVVEEGAGDQVDHRGRHGLGQLLSDGTCRRTGDD